MIGLKYVFTGFTFKMGRPQTLLPHSYINPNPNDVWKY